MSACGVPWPVCPDCLGVGLETSAGQSRCPRCRRVWPDDRVMPCPWPASVRLADADTGEAVVGMGIVCASHAAHPSAAGLRRKGGAR